MNSRDKENGTENGQEDEQGRVSIAVGETTVENADGDMVEVALPCQSSTQCCNLFGTCIKVYLTLIVSSSLKVKIVVRILHLSR